MADFYFGDNEVCPTAFTEHVYTETSYAKAGDDNSEDSGVSGGWARGATREGFK